jgi:hypothetical protein
MSAALLALLLCGTERWTVKTLADPAAVSVSLAPQHTTVAAMNAMPRHATKPQTPRIPGLETTLWDLTAVVCLVKSEKDSDLHVVIADTVAGCQRRGGVRQRRGSEFVGPTMIVESPSVECSAPSRFRTRLRAARAAVEGWRPGDTVHLQGFGLQDFPHGQTGRARSGIEVHPVLFVRPAR